MNHLERAKAAERMLIGDLLVRWDELIDVSDGIERDDWLDDGNRAIWLAMKDLHTSDTAVNIATVADWLDSRSLLGELDGGVIYLRSLFQESQTHLGEHHAQQWARMLRERRIRLKLAIGLEMVSKLLEANTDIDSLKAELSRLGDSLESVGRKKVSTLQAAANEYLDGIGTPSADPWKVFLPSVDAATGGVVPGEMVVIGARPSMGKTLMAMQWLDMAAEAGLPCLMISEEMSRLSLARRSLSSITVIPHDDWAKDMNRVRFDAKDHFSRRAPVFVAEATATIHAAEQVIARAVRKDAVKMVAVDYVQLLKGDGGNRYEQVSDVSTRLKRCATQHQIVVLLLAQLNRGIEHRDDARPRLSDLKDSGQLEQDADIVLFPFWPWKQDREYEDPDEYRIYHEKNRQRGIATNEIVVRIEPGRQRLRDFGGRVGEIDQYTRDF